MASNYSLFNPAPMQSSGLLLPESPQEQNLKRQQRIAEYEKREMIRKQKEQAIIEEAKKFWQSLNPAQKVGMSPVGFPFTDAIGLAGDVQMYKENPEMRSAGNYAMSGLGLLPFVPGVASTVMKNTPKRDMMFLHNTSPQGIKAQEDLGGMPSPSLAVTKQDVPFDKFGEVTLVGKPEKFDPSISKNAVYSSDAYTPRSPRPFNVAKKDSYKQFDSDYKDLASEFDESMSNAVDTLYSQEFKKHASSYKNSNVMQVFQGNLGRVKYLREKGVDIKPVYKKPMDLEIKPYDFRGKKKMIGLFDKKTGKKLYSVSQNEKINGRPSIEHLQDIKIANEKGGIDHLATHKKIRKEIEKFPSENFDSWIKSQKNKYFNKEEYFDAGGTSDNPIIKDYTLDNLVNYMKRQPQVGGESGIGSSGIGRLKSALTGKFKNLDEIRSSKSQIVDKQKSKELYEKTENQFFDIANDIYDGLPNAESYNQFTFIDYVNDSIFDAINNGATKESIKESFKVWKISERQVSKIHKFISDLKEAPVEYFEAKPARAVSFDEFSGAIVPKNIDKNTLGLLNEKGLKIVEYDPSVPQTRTEARQKFSDQMFNVLLPTTIAGGISRGLLKEEENAN